MMAKPGVSPDLAEMYMISTLDDGSGGESAEVPLGPARVLLLEGRPFAPGLTPSGIAGGLESHGFSVQRVESAKQALEALRSDRPGVLVLPLARDESKGSERLGEVRAAARNRGIPVLDVVNEVSDVNLSASRGPSAEGDDWVLRDTPAAEVAARVSRLLRTARAMPRSAMAPIDTRFASLLVHDLRTPLNVIGLSLRMIEQVLPHDDPDVAEDLRFIDENFRQIERMLSQLGDYARLFEPGLVLSVAEFSPRRLVEELIESRELRGRGKHVPIHLTVQDTCPAEAALDPARARMALDYALANAGAATNDDPVRVTIRGSGQRWIIEVAVDRPPPTSVQSTGLYARVYERLCGSAAERRGMDLAIIARVSELFVGTARLEVVPGRGTAIILDWPTRLAGVSPASE
jgi:signal transduction histidine kinase